MLPYLISLPIKVTFILSTLKIDQVVNFAEISPIFPIISNNNNYPSNGLADFAAKYDWSNENFKTNKNYSDNNH